MYVFISLLTTAQAKQQLRLTDYIPSTKANITVNFGSLRLKYAPTLFQITNSMQAQQINLRNILSTHSFSHFLHQSTFRANTAIQISKSRFADYLKSPISINSADNLYLSNTEYKDYNPSSTVLPMSRSKNAYTNASITYCSFVRCTAPRTIQNSHYYGGDICGGAVYIDAASYVSVSVCQFVDCAATSIGGSIYCNDISGTITLTECKFYNSSALIGAAIGIINSQTGLVGECHISFNLFEGCKALVIQSSEIMANNYKSIVHIYHLSKFSITNSGFTQNGPSASNTTLSLYGELSLYGGVCSASNLCFYDRNSYTLKTNTLIYYYSKIAGTNDLTYSSLSINTIDSSNYLVIKNIKVQTLIQVSEAGTNCQLSAVNTPVPTILPTRTPKTPTPSAPIPEQTPTPIIITPDPSATTPPPTEATNNAKATLSKKAKLGIGIGIPAFILLIVLIILIIWCVTRDTRTAFKPNEEEVDDELAFKNV
ncbi:hypothetical protein TVAG_221760 [Trichomonas vaginalis G3]|uniref:Polymorphic outer membrane protein n=1 Tax=Trichomonas vaginalis (strain ATCC PRA-98 / G3) TaxID=412133 RepID=A2E3D2_TRIV3|nr:pectin lyase-like family [Trichomonas vaginalis G3]EAY12823.1 hypothetical protein TVAG_221760 [Trichomonas vaginalis G3]KAI5488519.1 pectin lyase-like family [Trichomonas vaginalis G3]|eukprot:XP_001325046.1 hypothetical protein [Trichomonas vaginalis G3]